MGLASYEIVDSVGEWRVRHDGRADNTYQTKESAFEAAVAAASLALIAIVDGSNQELRRCQRKTI
jgi:hypothetical protein